MRLRKRVYFDMWGAERRETTLEYLVRKTLKPFVAPLLFMFSGLTVKSQKKARDRITILAVVVLGSALALVVSQQLAG